MTILRRASLLAPVAVLALVAPAGADTAPVTSGWWWRPQSGGLVPRPVVVPEGGMWVARDPSGDLAIAAVRIEVPPAGSARRLVLEAARVDGDPATVVVCRAAGAWEAADGGDWASRPDPDCDAGTAPATIESSDATSTFTFDLGRLGLDPGQAVDVVVLADPDAAAAGPFFSVAFNPVGASAVAIDAVPPVPAAQAPSPAPVADALATAPPPTAFQPAPLGFGAVEEPGRVADEVAARPAGPTAPSGAPFTPPARRPWLAFSSVAAVAALWGARAWSVQRRAGAHRFATARFAAGAALHDAGDVLLERSDVQAAT